MRGFVKIDRRLFASEMWKERRKFSRIEAWLDLMQRAAYRDEEGLAKGDVVISIRKTATRWGWPQTNVFRFIAKLVRDGYLTKTDREGVYNTEWNTERNAKRNTKDADNQQETKTSGTPQETQSGTPHLSYNKKNYKLKKGGVCLSHTPTPREEVRVTDQDWKRFQEWADTNIHWMSGNVTREMYTDMRQKVNDSRILADILIRIYLSGNYDTQQQISEQFNKHTA